MAGFQDDAWKAFQPSFATPCFSAQPLIWAAARSAEAMQTTLLHGTLDRLPKLAWATAKSSISAHFEFPDIGHCLAVEPHLWVDLTEPQVTLGLVRFIAVQDSKTRKARTWALLHALWRNRVGAHLEPLPPLDEVIGASVKAEAATGAGKRIDIIAWLSTKNGRRYGAVVEAKFGHHLTRDQLGGYQAAATARFNLALDRMTLAVVASSFTKATAADMRAHRHWQFVSWHKLITRLDTALALADADDQDFARFRRTIWHRTGA